MRIISLLPSATEIVCLLGLRERLVAVTHECDWPPSVLSLPRITSSAIPASMPSGQIDAAVSGQISSGEALYRLDEAMLAELAPDLILTQGLCQVCAVAEGEVLAAAARLPKRPRVMNLEPATLEGMLATILEVGEAAHAGERAREAVRELRARVDRVERISRRIADRPRVVFLEWIDPPFSAGHWDSEIVELAGGIECIARAGEPSRRLEWGEVAAAQPEVLFIACCGFDLERAARDLPALAAQPGFHELPAARGGRVYLCDGAQYFSRPGPRLVDSLEIMAHALHPGLHKLPAGLAPAARVEEAALRAAPEECEPRVSRA